MNIIRSIANSIFVVVLLFSYACFAQDAAPAATEKIKTEEPPLVVESTDTAVVSAQEKVSIFSNVVIGATLPLAKEGKLIEQGMDIVFRKVNRKGGINNKTIRLLALDDKKNIGQAVNNINDLVEKTPFLLSPFTVGVVSEILPLIKEKKVFVFGPEENSDSLYNPEYPYIVHTKPPLSRELEVVINYAYTTLRKRRFAFFYTDDEYGNAGIKSARNILKKHNLTSVAEGSYPSYTVDIEIAAKDIAKGRPDAIVCISRRHAAYNFILYAVNEGLTQTTFLGTSYLLPLQSMLKSARGINFVTTSTIPDPATSSLAIVDEYRKAMREYFPHQLLSTISLHSYINASIFIELLKKIPGIPTPEKVVNVVQGMKGHLFKGLVLDFDVQTQTLLDNLWISPGYREKWIEVEK